MNYPLGDFTLTVVLNGEEYNPEPFSIIAYVKVKDDKRWFHVVCNDIPCELCQFYSECKSTNATEIVSKYLKDVCLEAFI